MCKIDKRLIFIILIISLCFNLFFAIGYLYQRHVFNQLKTFEGRIKLVGRKLNLDKTQLEIFLEMAGKNYNQKMKIKNSYTKEADDFWNEMLKENPDSQKIEKLIELQCGLDKEAKLFGINILQEIFKALTPKQREDYINMIRKRGIE